MTLTDRENLINDTAWELYHKLVKGAGTGKATCVEFKDFSISYIMYPNSLVLKYFKGHQELHETVFNDNANINHLFIRDEIIKSTFNLYVKNALNTLSDEEINEVFDSHFGARV